MNNITEQHVLDAQREWAGAIIAIGKLHASGQDCEPATRALLQKLYAYGRSPVMFKPTRVSEHPFRNTLEDALSYFIGGKFSEDIGFARTPWSKIRFSEQQHILIEQGQAFAMGHYYFTNAATNAELKVDFTFGYKRGPDGSLVIFLQHSSLPFRF